MSKMKFVLNKQGVKDLMNSDHARAMLERIADNATGELGEGYGRRINRTGTRLRAGVFADSYEAKRENLEQNTILKAVKYND